MQEFLFASERHVNVECVVHIHATMEIILVNEGTLHMTVSGKEYDICAGQGIFVPPFETHRFHSEKPNRCHVLMFSRALVGYFFEFVKGKVPVSHRFAVSGASMRLAEELLPHVSNTADYIRAEAVLSPLCYDVWRGCAFEERKVPFDDTVARILEYMDEHLCEELTLERVARAVGVHPVTVSKMFSKHAGVGFQYYLQYQRCTHAATLVKSTDKSFARIAYDSGFGSIRSFNRAFLKIYGVTPTQYRATLENV